MAQPPPQFYVPGSTPAGWQTVGPSSSPYDNFGVPLDSALAGGQYRGPGGTPGMSHMGGGAGGMGMGGVGSHSGAHMGPQLGSHSVGGPGGGAASPLNDVLMGAGSGFIRTGLGAYGERLFGSGRDYVRSNMDKYFSSTELQYYFQVNHQYVRNKLKLILFPFLHRGQWVRITELVAGGLTFKPPRYDVNAPDLYIPFVSFASYVLVGAFALGVQGRFTPGVVSARVTRGLLAWALQALLLRSALYTLATGQAPLLDLVAYGGYAFVGVALSVLASLLWRHSFYPLLIWTCTSQAMFLVRTMKRVLYAETRQYDRDSSRHHYVLLLLGAVQFPLALWLCSL